MRDYQLRNEARTSCNGRNVMHVRIVFVGTKRYCGETFARGVKMYLKSKSAPNAFILRSANPASSLQFSNKELHYFEVEVEMPSLPASKKISTYDFNKTDGFTEFFEHLSLQNKPWSDVKLWEPLERDMSLAATCSALGHVAIKVVLKEGCSSEDSWSLECVLIFDFGMLPSFAHDAKKFYGK
jgi:hypothetical protein